MKEPRKIIAEKIIVEVEKLVRSKKLDYIDAVVHYCELNNADIEIVAGLIRSNAKITASIREEAEELNFLPKTSKLPF